MSTIELKVTSGNILQHIQFSIFLFLLSLIPLWFAFSLEIYNKNFVALFITGVVCILLISVPHYILFKSYHNVNKELIIKISDNNIIIKSNATERTISYDIIENIVFVELDIVGHFGIENYKYVRISLKDGTSILVTSLIYPNLIEILKYFDDIPIKFVNKFLPTINSNYENKAKNNNWRPEGMYRSLDYMKKNYPNEW